MKKYILENAFIRLTLLGLGATIYKMEIKPLGNRNVVLSTKDLANYYSSDNGYYGATIGRVAGRIGNAKFTLDGVTYLVGQNEKVTNSLHGGFSSFAFKDFTVVKEAADEIVFKYKSVDGEGGYPGSVTLFVTYKLSDEGFTLKYEATTTKKTLLNITNHSYFNLDGMGTIREHVLKADAHATYSHDEKQLNDTRVVITADHPFAISAGKKLEDIILHKRVNVPPTAGLDHLLEISGPLVLKGRDLALEVCSNYPAVQLYSTNFPSKFVLVSDEKVNRYHALAIEPVDIVKAVGTAYPNLEIAPDKPYERYITYKFRLL